MKNVNDHRVTRSSNVTYMTQPNKTT